LFDEAKVTVRGKLELKDIKFGVAPVGFGV
jgi:hypothetical protein